MYPVNGYKLLPKSLYKWAQDMVIPEKVLKTWMKLSSLKYYKNISFDIYLKYYLLLLFFQTEYQNFVQNIIVAQLLYSNDMDIWYNPALLHKATLLYEEQEKLLTKYREIKILAFKLYQWEEIF